MDEAFPDEIEKLRQEADDGNEEHAIRNNVKSDDGDGNLIIW